MNEVTHRVSYENGRTWNLSTKYEFKFSLRKLGKAIFGPMQIINEKANKQEHLKCTCNIFFHF